MASMGNILDFDAEIFRSRCPDLEVGVNTTGQEKGEMMVLLGDLEAKDHHIHLLGQSNLEDQKKKLSYQFRWEVQPKSLWKEGEVLYVL